MEREGIQRDVVSNSTALASAPATADDAMLEAYRPIQWDVHICRAACRKCGICVAICPNDVFDRDRFRRPQPVRTKRCNGCQVCIVHCPVVGLTVQRKPVTVSPAL